ncbi:MAG: hypothetical protein Q7T50_03415 [Candidatus Magasanikbacteria bacterium]|nr:hypothetical protein [Candidatus Magasanikbacteria bacterium]
MLNLNNLTILVVSGQYDLSDIKFKLECIGFKKSKIKIAINIDFALLAIDSMGKNGKHFDLIIFNCSDICDLEMIESLVDFKKKELVSLTPTIVMVHKDYLESLTNSNKFKDSKLIFEKFIFSEVSENELKEMIEYALKDKK